MAVALLLLLRGDAEICLVQKVGAGGGKPAVHVAHDDVEEHVGLIQGERGLGDALVAADRHQIGCLAAACGRHEDPLCFACLDMHHAVLDVKLLDLGARGHVAVAQLDRLDAELQGKGTV